MTDKQRHDNLRKLYVNGQLEYNMYRQSCWYLKGVEALGPFLTAEEQRANRHAR